MNKFSLIMLILSAVIIEAKLVNKNTYYEDNKKLEWERYYEDGKRDSIHKHYDKYGNLDIEEKYLNGILKGISIISHGHDVHWKKTD